MVEQVLLIEPLQGPPDVADALALAVCHLTTVPLRRAVGAALAEQVGNSNVTEIRSMRRQP
jgi:Holliday junction resolvasome RuvABC endonuclease subunit